LVETISITTVSIIRAKLERLVGESGSYRFSNSEKFNLVHFQNPTLFVSSSFCFHRNNSMLRFIANRPSHHTKQLWISGHSRLVTIRPFSRTPSILQANNINGPDTNKIYALPFKLSPERAPQVVELANYITEHKILGLFKLIKSVSVAGNDALWWLTLPVCGI
jgi:hypothetical protein